MWRSLAATLSISALFGVGKGGPDGLKPRQQNAQKNYIDASAANSAPVELQIATKAEGRNATGDFSPWMVIFSSLIALCSSSAFWLDD